MTNSTFGGFYNDDDSNMDLSEIGDMADLNDDGSIKTSRPPQARPGPVKDNLDMVFPRLTADELVSLHLLGDRFPRKNSRRHNSIYNIYWLLT